MKRNTSPTLVVNIDTDIENLKLIEFIFKREPHSHFPPLITKSYDQSNWKIQNGATPESFNIEIELSCEETMNLPSKTVYMDTRLVTLYGDVLETEIVYFNVGDTLFSEVYRE